MTYQELEARYEKLIAEKNTVNQSFYNGIFTRYEHPVLTREHIPPFWMYDPNPETNPFMMQRLGVNATLNSGAIKLNGKYCLMVRVEGMDRKSFFAVAESDRPTEGFRFRDYPVVLHPEVVKGKYAFYTRPMDDFIETGSGGGIGFGLCGSMENAVIDEEKIISLRRYHTITESKNGAGAVPIKTEKGWIHIAHGVRNTAAGLRYVLYAFATALDDPSRVIAEPSGMLLGPLGRERVGDVSNVVFTNGAIADGDGKVYIYYASSDTRMHVAETDVDRLCDYVFNTPADPLRSADCVRQRAAFIRKNLDYLKSR